jgi:hypothetical protein
LSSQNAFFSFIASIGAVVLPLFSLTRCDHETMAAMPLHSAMHDSRLFDGDRPRTGKCEDGAGVPVYGALMQRNPASDLVGPQRSDETV